MSAVSEAWDNAQTGGDNIPLARIPKPRDDLILQPVVSAVWSFAGVDPYDVLTLKEDVGVASLHRNLPVRVEHNLVDQNAMPGVSTGLIHVKDIIDHHADAGHHGEATRVINEAASCTSIVIDEAKTLKSMPSELLWLAVGAIMIDTEGFAASNQSRIKDVDRRAMTKVVNELASRFAVGEEVTEQKRSLLSAIPTEVSLQSHIVPPAWEELATGFLDAKYNVGHLSNYDLLRSDCKIVQRDRHAALLCVIAAPLRDRLPMSKGWEGFLESVQEVVKVKQEDRSVDVVVVMAENKGSEEDPKIKEIVLLMNQSVCFGSTKSKDAFERLAGILRTKHKSLPWTGGQNIGKPKSSIWHADVWRQGELEVTRKGTAPLISSWFESLSS